MPGVPGRGKEPEEGTGSEPTSPDSTNDSALKATSFRKVNHVIPVPRIILTRPSTSDENPNLVSEDPDDFKMEDGASGDDPPYSDCLNNAFYSPYYSPRRTC